MSDTQAERTPGTDRPAGYRGTRAASRPSGWVGWVIFAGVVMITLGRVPHHRWPGGLFEKGYYSVNSSHLVVHVNYSAWGWAHLALGALFILVGFGVLAGQTWARVVGIALAVISAVINLAFLAAYPVWGVILIALDIVIIYALAMHGGEMKEI